VIGEVLCFVGNTIPPRKLAGFNEEGKKLILQNNI